MFLKFDKNGEFIVNFILFRKEYIRKATKQSCKEQKSQFAYSMFQKFHLQKIYPEEIIMDIIKIKLQGCLFQNCLK